MTTNGSGRVAIVTGAGDGIGRASALALLIAGFRVVLAGRRRAALDAVLGDAQPELARHALAVSADVTDPVGVGKLFAATIEAFGRVDVLFNNAGTNVTNVSFEDLTIGQWNGVVGVNLTGSFLCAQAAFRQMKAQKPRGGRIINNGSVSAHVPRPDSAAYTASKHAVTGLTRSIALDGRAYDIACSQIDIGNAQTKLSDRMAKGVKQADGRIAAEPMMDVAHVAEMVVSIAKLPVSVNVPFMTVMATGMPYIGRG
jgi:NAD(P)-dependent dehydrogenase (short-subunit alcohol dehydrogenase family)